MTGFAWIDDYLHEHIPVTRHMGVSVTGYDGASVRLAAPLAANLNHRRTAFGGSISTLGILAGWTLLHLHFSDRAPAAVPRLVIQRSETDFDAAVTSDFEALCRQPDTGRWERFNALFERRGRARITLVAEIIADGRCLGRHSGDYVALRPVE